MNTHTRHDSLDGDSAQHIANFQDEIRALREALRIERLARMEAERRVVELEALHNGEDLDDDEPHRDEFDSGIPRPGM